MTARRRWRHPARTTVLFTFGLLGVIYETLVDKIERPSLLIVFAACLGLPAFLTVDESRHGDDEKPPPKESPPESGAEK